MLQFKDKLLPSSARLTAIKGALFSWHPREIRIAQHMNNQLNHNGQQMGTFTREQVEGMIRGVAITYETLGRTEGETVWRPVRDLMRSGTGRSLRPGGQRLSLRISFYERTKNVLQEGRL